jgi:TetR/AcrR family transcriptional regulator, mexJK operon transcriptional repressor
VPRAVAVDPVARGPVPVLPRQPLRRKPLAADIPPGLSWVGETMMADGTTDKLRRGRKYDQVLAGARDVFLSDGFEGASVDDIARAAGVSKATLYSYFPDKRLLFMEVARIECLIQADRAIAEIDVTAPVERVLLAAATKMVDFITSDFGQRIFRICVAESERFPDLGQAFYDSGPALIRHQLVCYFQLAIQRGELRIDDPDLAADQFHSLCKAGIVDRLAFTPDRTFTAALKDRVIDGAVTTFLARYGTAGRVG